MAIYHCSVKPVQRSKARSAVAAAAYRSRSAIYDERTGLGYSYEAKSRDLVHAEIVGFPGDRASLWNLAEACETRKDATTAREFEVALPAELSREENIELTRQFSEWLNETQGCAVDFCIHSGAGDNPHAHILTTTRSVDEKGTFSAEKIAREWSDKKRKAHGLPGRQSELMTVRKQWEQFVNAQLEPENQVDHRSHQDRGLDEVPQIHIGPTAHAMQKEKGIKTERVKRNEEIKSINVDIRNLLGELDEVHQEKEKAGKENIRKQTIALVEKEPLPEATGMNRRDQSALSKWWESVKERLEKATRKFKPAAKTFSQETAQDHAQTVAAGKNYSPELIEKAGLMGPPKEPRQPEPQEPEKGKSSLLEQAQGIEHLRSGKLGNSGTKQPQKPTWKRWGDHDPYTPK